MTKNLSAVGTRVEIVLGKFGSTTLDSVSSDVGSVTGLRSPGATSGIPKSGMTASVIFRLPSSSSFSSSSRMSSTPSVSISSDPSEEDVNKIESYMSCKRSNSFRSDDVG